MECEAGPTVRKDGALWPSSKEENLTILIKHTHTNDRTHTDAILLWLRERKGKRKREREIEASLHHYNQRLTSASFVIKTNCTEVPSDSVLTIFTLKSACQFYGIFLIEACRIVRRDHFWNRKALWASSLHNNSENCLKQNSWWKNGLWDAWDLFHHQRFCSYL